MNKIVLVKTKIYYKFRKYGCAFHAGAYFVLFVSGLNLFALKMLFGKDFWKGKQKRKKKKKRKDPQPLETSKPSSPSHPSRGPALSPLGPVSLACLLPHPGPLARPTRRPGRPARTPSFSSPLWPTAGPCPFSHCDVGPTRQCPSFFLLESELDTANSGRIQSRESRDFVPNRFPETL